MDTLERIIISLGAIAGLVAFYEVTSLKRQLNRQLWKVDQVLRKIWSNLKYEDEISFDDFNKELDKHYSKE